MAREHRASRPPHRLDRHSLSVAVQIQSIQRAAAVLRVLTGHSRPRALGELAAELELPKGTVYGILRTLQTVGFVEQDAESRRYQLGAALLHIGSGYLNGSELRRCALGHAEALAKQTGESVRIGTLHGNVVLIVHHALGPDEALQAPDVGSLMPLHATALGKALLADHPGRGWASDVGEFLPGIASIAAPIEAHDSAVAGAIAISGPTARICEDGSPRAALVGYVVESARRISRQLGRRLW